MMGMPIFRFRSTLQMDLMVLMAAMPSAPPSKQALATGTMSVILGVILAIMGSLEPRFTAAQKLLHSSALVPTSEPMAWEVI